MIYVKRDPAVIPPELFKMAEEAQAALELLPPEERIAFIKKKASVWRQFKTYLSQMSHGKCWYSEAPDVQSFFDVDHFRPKSEARRSEHEVDDGYPWLAFDWDNFRFSAGRSNKLSTDEDTGDVVGKASWFPLVEGSAKACWEDRCVDKERPMLLDPTREADMRLITVGADGYIKPSQICVGVNKSRVAESAKRYGLDLPRVRGARLKVMREVAARARTLLDCVELANDHEAVADKLPIETQAKDITDLTLASSPYALAARSTLHDLGLGVLIAS